MWIVDHPTLTPSCCMFTLKAGVPCIDFGKDFDFNHQGRMYVSVTTARDMGKLVGLVEPEDQTDEVGRLTAELKQARAELEELREFKAAVDVIESQEFRARKKPGRPKTKEASTVA